MKGQKLHNQFSPKSSCECLLQYCLKDLEVRNWKFGLKDHMHRVMLSLHCSKQKKKRITSNKNGVLSHITCICDSSFSQVCRDYQVLSFKEIS